MWRVALVCLLVACLCYGERSFVIDYEHNQFLKDGEPFRYISGGMHYFRVPRYYWNDRLQKIRASGANAVQTYIAWNLHEPEQGKYNFDDELDISHFIELAQQNDLLVIIRAGPYICAEWDFGGLPSWLLKNRSVALRQSTDPDYVYAVDSWLGILLSRLRPLLYENGGPIISVQVENEYGSYFACDSNYILHLESMFRFLLGDNVILFTTDGYNDEELKCGGAGKLYRTVDFGASDPTIPFKQQRKFQPKGPLVNSEYYTGWLDTWGQPHQRRDTKTIATYLDKILAMNASVNMYMFEGGTNFGFMNGADMGSTYNPVPTSYDYDAPLSEAGDPTEKYEAIKTVISKYTNVPPQPTPPATKKIAYGKFPVLVFMSIYLVLPNIFPKGPTSVSRYPQSMEDVGQSYGFALYRTSIAKFSNGSVMLLDVGQVRDRIIVLVDQVVQGRLDRNGKSTIAVKSGTTLDLMIENEGRINYGRMNDPKGLLTNVTLSSAVLENWEMYSLPSNADHVQSVISQLNSRHPKIVRRETNTVSMVPSYVVVQFDVEEAADTYLKLDNWGKGIALVNLNNLGRYWQTAGPQETLFVPKPFLKSGTNTLVLFEMDQSPCLTSVTCSVEFVDAPVWKS